MRFHLFGMIRNRLVPSVICSLCVVSTAGAVDLDEARALAESGEYEQALQQATTAVDERLFGEGWHLLKVDMELMLGKYSEARATIEAAMERYAWSVRLRWRLRKAALFTGDVELAAAQIEEIKRLVETSPWRYSDSDNLITLGEISLALGDDAKAVQETFLKRARRNNPQRAEPRIALGMLALEKRDFDLAAETFRAAAQEFPESADVQYGLAASLQESDPEAATAALNAALLANPKHIPSLIMQAESFIDREQYDDAESALNRVLNVNPLHPAALAYWSAIAHLKGDAEAEVALREEALSTWAANPEVDHIIGRELSQKYRFAEGAAHQGQALDFNPAYLPAKKQLAEDLLRLGEEQRGWQLADEAFAVDEYDVGLYNLLELRDELENFKTLESDSFVVRMHAREADVYGQDVLRLLQRAEATLCAKYQMELPRTVTVEIFPNADDFAVRTFGMPGVSGYLGVCFGNVITANSPAAQLSPSNWESVLWHEFAHVVTLNVTRNKTPRWLSEGISVYEERQADPAWGERMTPAYRDLIVGGELTPIADLSSAFLNPKSSLHVQFAYYESSLVVEYLIDEFGFDALIAILHDLGEGVAINDAIERHTAPLEVLEVAFKAYVDEQAQAMAPDADWTAPELQDLIGDDNADGLLRDWANDHPQHIRGLTAYAQYLIRNEAWDEAVTVLEQLIELYPGATGPESAAWLLANVHQRRGDEESELAVLRDYAELDDDATDAYLRIMELEAARGNWEAVQTNALRVRAVNPLIPQCHRSLAEAAEQLDRPEIALAAYHSMLALSPTDPALVHYRIADLEFDAGNVETSRRHVLLALENAPRFRDAHTLLLKITRTETPDAPPAGTDELPPSPTPGAAP